MWWVCKLCEHRRLQRSNSIHKFCRTRRTNGLPPIGGCRLPFAQQTMPCNPAPMYQSIIKKYSNWNVCFSCGFEVEGGHTLKTCPTPWRCANHQEGFDRNTERGRTRVPEQCTRVSCPICDGVGRSR